MATELVHLYEDDFDRAVDVAPGITLLHCSPMPPDPVREAAAQAIATAEYARKYGEAAPWDQMPEHYRRGWLSSGERLLDALQAAGWSLAPPGHVVVQLPEHSHAVPSDGAASMYEQRVWLVEGRSGGVDTATSYELPDGGSGVHLRCHWLTTADEAERYAAHVLAAAHDSRSRFAREATPAPESGGPG